jgi:hypothetical protein
MQWGCRETAVWPRRNLEKQIRVVCFLFLLGRILEVFGIYVARTAGNIEEYTDSCSDTAREGLFGHEKAPVSSTFLNSWHSCSPTCRSDAPRRRLGSGRIAAGKKAGM